MILRPFASGSKADTGHLTRPTPRGLVEENGREWPQKGDFNGQMSFAIASSISSGAIIDRKGKHPQGGRCLSDTTQIHPIFEAMSGKVSNSQTVDYHGGHIQNRYYSSYRFRRLYVIVNYQC